MCGPPALALAAAGLAAAGSAVGALQANAQARYQARVAEQNAALAREASQQEAANTRESVLAQYRQIGQVKGQQRVAAAANGVAVDWGTSADLLTDTEALGREDVDRLYRQGAQRQRGFDIEASNHMGEASAQRQAGKGALIKGAFDFGSTILGGVQQYNKLRPSYGKG